MKHTNRSTLYAHYTFFPWTSKAHSSEIMYITEVIQNSLTFVANNNTLAGPI